MEGMILRDYNDNKNYNNNQDDDENNYDRAPPIATTTPLPTMHTFGFIYHGFKIAHAELWAQNPQYYVILVDDLSLKILVKHGTVPHQIHQSGVHLQGERKKKQSSSFIGYEPRLWPRNIFCPCDWSQSRSLAA